MPTNGNDTLLGGGVNDTIDGLAGNDSISGVNGDDSLLGSAGDDTLRGGLGNDTLNGGADKDSLFGDAGDDVLRGGGAGADFVSGGIDNDLVFGDLTLDDLRGDDGFDTISYAGLTAGVSLSLAAGLAQGGFNQDSLAGFEAATGSAFADTLIGTTGANRLSGGAGNDLIQGGAGDDTIDGGTGSDNLDGGADGASATIDLVSYRSASAGVVLSLLTGRATVGLEVDTLAGFALVEGSIFNDTLIGDAGWNELRGGGGDDVLVSGGGLGNNLDGGAGRDTVSYAGATAGVTVDLASGQATISDGFDDLLSIEAVQGSGFNDRLSGTVQADVLIGGDGADTLVVRGGGDILNGGAGVDVADFEDVQGGVNVSLARESLDVIGDSGEIVGVEVVRGGNFEDTLEGAGQSETLMGLNGDDALNGADGDDVLTGGVGRDWFYFSGLQHGADTLTDWAPETGDQIFLEGGAAVTAVATGLDLDLDGQTDDTRVLTSGGTINVLNLTFASLQIGSGADGVTLTGVDDSDILIGSSGDDRLIGGGGADTIFSGPYFGGDRNKHLEGGTGSDVLIGSGASTDLGVWRTATGQVVVNLVSQIANSAELGFDRLIDIDGAITGSGADIVLGNSGRNHIEGGGGADWLSGGDSHDTLLGGEGDDALIGGDGNDLMIGGLGNDFHYGGAGIDTINFNDMTAPIVANLATGFVNIGNGAQIEWFAQDIERFQFGDGADRVIGWTQNLRVNLSGGDDWFADYSAGNNDFVDGSSGADTIYGLAGNDSLLGGSENDFLAGGAGNDILDGGWEQDQLFGGAGADRFMFSFQGQTSLAAPDIIGDFETGIDKIDLIGIDAIFDDSGVDDAFTIVSNLTGVAGQLAVRGFGSYWVLDGDTNGDAVADIRILVVTPTLVAADILT